MADKKLVEKEGSHLCEWCFARDDTVMHEPTTNTYWHKDCYDVSGGTSHSIQSHIYPYE